MGKRDALKKLRAEFKAPGQYKEIWATTKDGQSIAALINGNTGWLMYLRHHRGDAGFRSHNPDYAGPEDAVQDYILSNGQRDEYPLAWALLLITPGYLLSPRSAERKAVAEVYHALARDLRLIGTPGAAGGHAALAGALNANQSVFGTHCLKALEAEHFPQAASACRRCVRHPKVTVRHSPQVAKQRSRCFRQPEVKVQRGGVACYAADVLFP